MHRLEEETIPILEPMMMGRKKRFRLSEQDQLILAKWAYKTALVADFVVNEKRIIPADTYRKF